MGEYPQTRRDDVVEVLHGHRIGDPYRWLEDPDSDETADWVKRQNEVTETYLETLPERAWFRDTMRAILARPRAGVPFRTADRYFVTRNDGTQNQDVLYVAESLAELRAGGRVLVDPNTFSEDGTSSMSTFTVARTGGYAAYGRSDGGSDWATFHLLDLATGAPVADPDVITKFSAAEWLPDGRSYLYTHFDHEGGAEGTETAALAGPRLRLHRLGEDQAEDQTVLVFPENDQLFFWAELTHDQRYVVVAIVEGTENRNRIWVYPITDEDGRSGLAEPIKIIDEVRAEFAPVLTDGTTLYLRTDLDAERGRLVSVDLAAWSAGAGFPEFREVIAESEHTLSSVDAVGDGFIAVYLVDAQPEVRRFDRDGTDLGPIAVSGGAVLGVEGEPGDPEFFVGLSAVTSPTESYRVDAATGEVMPLPDLGRVQQTDRTRHARGGSRGSPPLLDSVPSRPGSFAPPAVRIERFRATSADGTEVPYFLVSPADADRSRPQPTLLWGYGGFKVPLFADYRPGWSGWLAAGGLLAIANLRGGGEFGTEWYEAGRLDRKQNVFDDFIAVAEHLIATGVTTPAQLALHGRSNGGLLVGAVMTQRPDLAAVALPAVGVLDLLRFHRFTIGAAWISDYGDPDDPEQFEVALAYSPLHNVRPGTRYPATLIATGDHDDRVVPLHSHKFTSALQHAQAGDAPILTRIEVATGHGLGKPTALVAAEWADLLAFAAHHTGLSVPHVAWGTG